MNVTAEGKRLSAGLLTGLALAVSAPAPALADDQTIRIGLLNDMSGPYADFQGPGSVLAARLAVEDYGARQQAAKSR
jgi:branched-chain amino acid transport system substrate-binding protein